MKRIFKTLAILAMSVALVVPSAEAQGRRDRNGGRATSSATHSAGSRGGNRPSGNHGNSNRPGNGGQRPGGNHSNNSRPGGNQGNNGRPNNGNNRPGNDSRPGGNQGNNNRPNNGNNRPGNNQPGGQRPGNGGQRPGNNPGNNQPGGQRPGNGGQRPGHGPGVRPPHNAPLPHYRPVYHSPWVRPVPPRAWRPGPRVPVFSTILGLTFGIGVNATLDYLVNNNYTIYAYNNNEVYLNDVTQLNLLWPDATLYYNGGRLDRGDFIYATSYYDTSRYNLAYSRLVNAYGNPVSTTYPNNGLQTTWYGNNGRFVTLTYQPLYGADGVYRYYTTLSFGM